MDLDIPTLQAFIKGPKVNQSIHDYLHVALQRVRNLEDDLPLPLSDYDSKYLNKAKKGIDKFIDDIEYNDRSENFWLCN